MIVMLHCSFLLQEHCTIFMGHCIVTFLEHLLHSVFVCCVNCVQYMTDRQWYLFTQKAPVGANKRVVNFLDDNELKLHNEGEDVTCRFANQFLVIFSCYGLELGRNLAIWQQASGSLTCRTSSRQPNVQLFPAKLLLRDRGSRLMTWWLKGGLGRGHIRAELVPSRYHFPGRKTGAQMPRIIRTYFQVSWKWQMFTSWFWGLFKGKRAKLEKLWVSQPKSIYLWP